MKFEEITGNSQRIQESHENNYVEWGAPLTLADYLEREQLLHDIHTRNELRHRVFALIDATHRVVAACEVLSRPLYLGGGAYTTDHCFASVFVVKEHRGKGLGAELMTQATKAVTVPEDQLSLWSDVGDYYARFGFSFPLSFEDEPRWSRTIVCRGTGKPVECERLDLAKTNSQILPEHTNMLTRHADSIFYECKGDIKIVIVAPHRGLYEQLQFRAVYTAEKLGLVQPTKFSARTTDGHGWISWTYMFPNKKVLILGIFGSANEIATLLAAATEEAIKYDCVVELYETSMTDVFGPAEEAALKTLGVDFEIKDRRSSLPMSSGTGIWVCPGGYAWY